MDGTLQKFEAYGMESITGVLTQLDGTAIKKIFPHLDEYTIRQMKRADQVDFLIGIKHASWHPERAEQARDGDFWFSKGRVGVCVGGRHPLIDEHTRKSDALFSVVHYVHHARVGVQEISPHELEFCPRRSVTYRKSLSRFEEIKPSTTSAPIDLLPSSSTDCFVTKTAPINPDEMFFLIESLCTMIEPKCGSCACSKCPIPG